MRLAPGLWHALKVEVEGPALRLYLYGRPVLTATDDALARGGAGLIQQGGDNLYDAVSVRGPALVMGVPLPFHDDFEQGPTALWNVVEGDWTTIADGTQVYHAPIYRRSGPHHRGRPVLERLYGRSKSEGQALSGARQRLRGLSGPLGSVQLLHPELQRKRAGEFRITKQLNGQFTRLAGGRSARPSASGTPCGPSWTAPASSYT